MEIETHRAEVYTDVSNLISITRRGTNTVLINVDELIQYETGAVIVLKSGQMRRKIRDGVGFTPRHLSLLLLGAQLPVAQDLVTRIALDVDYKLATDPSLRQPLFVTAHVKLIRDRRFVIPPPPPPPHFSLPTPSSRGASSQVFERLAEEQRVESRDLVGKNETLCSICIDDLSESRENIIELPLCLHIFHQDCLFEWLRRNNSCPLCRRAPYEYDQETLTRLQ